MFRMRVLLLTTLLLIVAAMPASAARGGVPGSPIASDAIWADGDLHGTIGQGSLRYNGNESSFDKLYQVPGQQPVSEAGPGNRDYSGGRWLPVTVTWNVAPYLLTSGDAVLAAADAGDISLGVPDFDGAFLCPLLKNH